MRQLIAQPIIFMMQSSIRACICSILLLLAFLPMSVLGQINTEFSSASIRDILRFLEKSHQDVSTLSQTKKFLVAQYDSLVFDIDGIKQTNDIGFFDRLQLKNLLKESEDIAKQIIKIDNLLKAHEDANRQQVAVLVELMDNEITDTVRVLQLHVQNKSVDLAEDVLKLKKMFSEKNFFQVYRMKKFIMPVSDIRTQRQDDAEVLYQKADYLLDQLDRFNSYSEELNRMILFCKTENNLKNRVRRMTGSLNMADAERTEFMFYFPDSLVALQRLPLSKNLIAPLDDYETLIERLAVEKEAALGRIRLSREMSVDIREIADYKTKIWVK